MEKFELSKSNGDKIAFVMKNHLSNARGILKNEFNITDEDFGNIMAHWELNKLAYYTSKKKRVMSSKQIKNIISKGCFVDKENKSISVNPECKYSEIKEDIEYLMSIGYTIQRTTFI